VLLPKQTGYVQCKSCSLSTTSLGKSVPNQLLTRTAVGDQLDFAPLAGRFEGFSRPGNVKPIGSDVAPATVD
jgi:hypothetical protein